MFNTNWNGCIVDVLRGQANMDKFFEGPFGIYMPIPKRGERIRGIAYPKLWAYGFILDPSMAEMSEVTYERMSPHVCKT